MVGRVFDRTREFFEDPTQTRSTDHRQPIEQHPHKRTESGSRKVAKRQHQEPIESGHVETLHPYEASRIGRASDDGHCLRRPPNLHTLAPASVRCHGPEGPRHRPVLQQVHCVQNSSATLTAMLIRYRHSPGDEHKPAHPTPASRKTRPPFCCTKTSDALKQYYAIWCTTDEARHICTHTNRQRFQAWRNRTQLIYLRVIPVATIL